MKTEFEINRRLAELDIRSRIKDIKSIEYDDVQNVLWVESIGFSSFEIKDYCNSWDEMGPIILKNGIDVISPESNGSKYWQCVKFYPTFQPDINSIDLNPLKAAALVAIEILEGRL